MTRYDPVTIGMRVVDATPGHVTTQVWIGRNKGARANSGQIVWRADEWKEMVLRVDCPFDVMDVEWPYGYRSHPTTGMPFAMNGGTCGECFYFDPEHDRKGRPQCRESLGPVANAEFHACSRFRRVGR